MVAKVVAPETTISPEMTNGLNITRMEYEEKNGLTRTHIAFWQGYISEKIGKRNFEEIPIIFCGKTNALELL